MTFNQDFNGTPLFDVEYLISIQDWYIVTTYRPVTESDVVYGIVPSSTTCSLEVGVASHRSCRSTKHVPVSSWEKMIGEFMSGVPTQLQRNLWQHNHRIQFYTSPAFDSHVTIVSVGYIRCAEKREWCVFETKKVWEHMCTYFDRIYENVKDG